MKTEEVLDYYTGFAEAYDATVMRDRDYIAFEKISAWILQLLPRKECQVLDLGCGTGLSAKPFFEAGHAVTGLDLTPAMLEKAQALPFTELICQSLDLPLEVTPDHFQAAVLLGVMEFILDPERLFRDVAKSLKSAGLFGLTLPKKLPAAIEDKLGIKSYTEQMILPLLWKAGFTLLRWEEFQGFESDGETVRYYGVLVKKASVC